MHKVISSWSNGLIPVKTTKSGFSNWIILSRNLVVLRSEQPAYSLSNTSRHGVNFPFPKCISATYTTSQNPSIYSISEKGNKKTEQAQKLLASTRTESCFLISRNYLEDFESSVSTKTQRGWCCFLESRILMVYAEFWGDKKCIEQVYGWAHEYEVEDRVNPCNPLFPSEQRDNENSIYYINI